MTYFHFPLNFLYRQFKREKSDLLFHQNHMFLIVPNQRMWMLLKD